MFPLTRPAEADDIDVAIDFVWRQPRGFISTLMRTLCSHELPFARSHVATLHMACNRAVARMPFRERWNGTACA